MHFMHQVPVIFYSLSFHIRTISDDISKRNSAFVIKIIVLYAFKLLGVQVMFHYMLMQYQCCVFGIKLFSTGRDICIGVSGVIVLAAVLCDYRSRGYSEC